MTAEEKLAWLEAQARQSYTGISFDWVPSVDGEPSGFRFMRRGHIGEPHKSLGAAIEDAAKMFGQGVHDQCQNVSR